ncbi:MAG: fluoride efflux transporter CrcB [Salinibacterium sp.]|nr:MAG: fluoride efflux transporter CrcB [Salinibacterium sp.]
MTPLLFASVAAAGGVGASFRLLVDGFVRSRSRGGYPFGTTIINITGSLALGFVVGLALNSLLPEMWRQIIGTGLLGGYTTFSTASFETVRLLQERRQIASILNGFGMLVGAVLAAALGLWLASLL